MCGWVYGDSIVMKVEEKFEVKLSEKEREMILFAVELVTDDLY